MRPPKARAGSHTGLSPCHRFEYQSKAFVEAARAATKRRKRERARISGPALIMSTPRVLDLLQPHYSANLFPASRARAKLADDAARARARAVHAAREPISVPFAEYMSGISGFGHAARVYNELPEARQISLRCCERCETEPWLRAMGDALMGKSETDVPHDFNVFAATLDAPDTAFDGELTLWGNIKRIAAEHGYRVALLQRWCPHGAGVAINSRDRTYAVLVRDRDVRDPVRLWTDAVAQVRASDLCSKDIGAYMMGVAGWKR